MGRRQTNDSRVPSPDSVCMYQIMVECVYFLKTSLRAFFGSSQNFCRFSVFVGALGNIDLLQLVLCHVAAVKRLLVLDL